MTIYSKIFKSYSFIETSEVRVTVTTLMVRLDWERGRESRVDLVQN